MKKYFKTIIFVFIAGILFNVNLFCTDAWADVATEARFHFQRGMELFKQGKIEDALEQFLLSNRLVKNPNAVFNAAKCFEKIGRLNEAFTLYSEYLLFDLSSKERLEAQSNLKQVENSIATVLVESSPPNAQIYVDREELGSWGETPRTVAISPGKHKITLKLPNFHPQDVEIESHIGSTTKINVNLMPILSKIRLVSNVSDIKSVFVTIDNGEKKKLNVPAEMEVQVGVHSIKIEAEGFVPIEKSVNVIENEILNVDFTLPPLPPPAGTMNIISSPSSALVKLDGKEFGFTPLVKSTPAGRHSILVSSKGMKPWKGKFELRENETLFLTVDMVPEAIPRKYLIAQKALWGFSGLLAAVGTATGITTLVRHKQFDEDPSSRLEYQGEFLNLVTDVAFAGAILILTATTVWYFVSKKSTKMESRGEFSRESSFLEKSE